jgi:hypothetical protein
MLVEDFARADFITEVVKVEESVLLEESAEERPSIAVLLHLKTLSIHLFLLNLKCLLLKSLIFAALVRETLLASLRHLGLFGWGGKRLIRGVFADRLHLGTPFILTRAIIVTAFFLQYFSALALLRACYLLRLYTQLLVVRVRLRLVRGLS